MTALPSEDRLSEVLWQIPPCVQLHWKRWDEQYAVYNAASGHTHVLDALGALLIQQIAEHPFSTPLLVAHLASLLAVDTTQEFKEKLQHMVGEFEKLGLIEAASS